MRKANIGSICIGISDYSNEEFNRSEDRLRFASNDAEWLHEYFLTIDNNIDRTERHLLLTNHDATASSIKKAVEKLSRTNTFGLFVVFLGGHGSRSLEQGWFYTTSARPNEKDLDGVALDELLKMVSTHSLLMFADCCNAEGLMHGCTYFTHPGQKGSRLFIGSSRVEQRSWEAQETRHSLFMHLIKRSLMSKVRSKEYLDIEAELFPILRDELPLLAMRLKQGIVQEPIKIGSINRPILLRRPDSHQDFRTEGPWRTARVLIRRSLLAIFATSTVAAIVIQFSTYNFALEQGTIVLRTGIREIQFLMPDSISKRIETNLSVTNLSETSRAVQNIQDGDVWGIWWQQDEQGQRAWKAQIAPYLNEKTKSQLSVLTTLSPQESDLNYDDNYGLSLASRAVILNPTAGAKSAWTDMLEPLADDSAGCGEPIFAGMVGLRPHFAPDTSLEAEKILRGVALGALSGQLDDFHILHRLTQATASLSHIREQNVALNDARELTKIYENLSDHRDFKKQSRFSKEELDSLLTLVEDGCGPWVFSSLALALEPSSASRYEAQLADILSNSSGTTNNLNTLQLIALDGLVRISAKHRKPLHPSAADFLMQETDISWWPINFHNGEEPNIIFGPELREWLFEQAEQRLQQNDLVYSISVIDTLTSQATLLTQPDMDRLENLIAQATEMLPSLRFPRIVEGQIRNANQSVEEKIKFIIDSLDWSYHFSQTDEDNIMLSLGPSLDEYLAASRVIQIASPLPGVDVRLRQFLYNNSHLDNLTEVYRALAMQEYADKLKIYTSVDDDESTSNLILKRLMSYRRDAIARNVEVLLLNAELETVPTEVRLKLSESLRVAWAETKEPEIKWAIADLIFLIHAS